MLPSFTPNGGRGLTLGRQHRLKSHIYNHYFHGLAADGMCLVFPLASVPPSDLLHVHVSPLVHALKEGGTNPLGRTCLDLSRSSPDFPSVNSSVDLAASSLLYPPATLPTIRDLADMALDTAARSPDGRVSSAVMDVTAAYHQLPLSVDAALLTATIIDWTDPKAPDAPRIPLLVIYLTGEFGYAATGHAYNLVSNAIDHAHNAPDPLHPRIRTYVDDGILNSHPSAIAASLASAASIATAIMGPQAIDFSSPKVGITGPVYTAIGFTFDLRPGRWFVYPKRRAILKMYHLLHHLITDAHLDPSAPAPQRTVSVRLAQTLVSTLQFYSVVVPAGSAFLGSIRACIPPECSRLRTAILSPRAQADILWWRCLVTSLAADPSNFARPLYSIANLPSADIWLVTDASSTVGGGGWFAPPRTPQSALSSISSLTLLSAAYALSTGHGPLPTPLYPPPPSSLATAVPPSLLSAVLVLRWTPEELQLILARSLSINVLEYFVAAYAIMLAGPSLHGRAVGILIDNTAAMHWLGDCRAGSDSVGGQELAKLFTLYCLQRSIHLTPLYISTRSNTLADLLSRDLSLQVTSPPLLPAPDTRAAHWWRPLPRSAILRALLSRSVSSPAPMPMPQLLDILNRLLE